MSNYNVNLTDITDTRQVNVNVTTGDKGWSAELVMVRRESDGALVALREWIGGSGEKPTPPQYVAEDGFTDDIEEAVNFKGDKGDKPNHEWIGYSLRFELPNGDWGIATDLRGEKGEQGEQGDQGFTPYIGDNGNWWIDDQDLGFSPDAYIAINSTSLPTPETSNNFSLVTEGTYTRSGQSDVVVPEGKMGILTWNGTEWSLASTMDLPQVEISSTIDPSETEKAVNGKAVADYVAIKQNGGYLPENATIHTEGRYRSTNGTSTQSPAYQFSDFLPVSKGDKIEVTVESVTTSIPIALLYKENQTFDSILIPGTTEGVVTRQATIETDGFICINNKKDNGQVIVYKKYSEPTVAQKTDLENYVVKPVKNKLLNPHKYGISFVDIASTLPNLRYDKAIKAWSNSSLSLILHLKKDLIPLENQGKYLGLVVDAGQTLLHFRTEVSSPFSVIDVYTRVNKGDRDILYLDISKEGVDRVLLQVPVGTLFKIYNIFTSDTIDFVTLPDDGIVIDEDVEINPFYWDLNYRKDYTPPFVSGNVYSPTSRYTYYDSNFFKRYLFFDVDTSFPESNPTVFLVGAFSTSTTTYLSRAVLIPGESFMLDIGESFAQARGIGFTQRVVGAGFTQLRNIRVSDSRSITTAEPLEIPAFETSYEAKDIGLDLFRVGDTIFTGKAPEFAGRNVDYRPNGWSDVSMYEYSGKKIGTKEVVDNTIVDTGTRALIGVYENHLWFKNESTNKVEKISFNDFLESLELHNLSGRAYTNLTYLELPEGSTDETAKQELYAKMTPNWRMLASSYSPEVFDIADTNLEAQTFSNGNILSGNKLIKQDGTSYVPKLKNPVSCNPSRLLIYDDSNELIEDIDLSAQESGIEWGDFNANQGAITYPDTIKAGIGFINGKSITVAVDLLPGDYKLVWRCRRYGTNTVDSIISIESDGYSGEIAMDTRSGVGELIDYEKNISLSSSIAALSFTSSCASQTDLLLGNDASSIGSWGRNCRGRFGTIAEYAPAPARRSGLAYLTQDYGETWEAIFDMSLNTVLTGSNAYHLHGACYDPVWNQMILVNGDNNPNRPFLVADINRETTIDNVKWRLPQNYLESEYILLRGEQYCSVFADDKAIYYGTDYSINGVFRMNRIEKGVDTKREPCFITQSSQTLISHIPTEWFKDPETGEVFSYFILGDNPQSADWEYQTHLIVSTLDGITWREIWRDNVRRGSFNLSVYTRMYKIGDHLICQTFRDNRFSSNRSLMIMKYK